MYRYLKVRGKGFVLAALATVSLLILTGCGPATPASRPGVVRAVGAENEYADVISQIGGQYVSVSAIMSNPNTDPHTYEADPRDAARVGAATLVVQNGLGYDDFMAKLEGASPNPGRDVIDVAASLGYAVNTPDPHLWYNPRTMPRVAALIARDLAAQMPAQAQYFAGRLDRFDNSLEPWRTDLAGLRQAYPGTPVAVTEPVADYLLRAAGLNIETPWGFQAAVMNGTDPAPQDVQTQENLLRQKRVKVLVYNRQAVDNVTDALLQLAKDNDIPVVGVYETMPSGLTYQAWMEKETNNLMKAIKGSAETVS